MKEHAQVNLGVKVILLNEKGEVLGLEAQDNGPIAHYYDLPGGRIDVDEIGVPFTDIAAREIKEEVGDLGYDLLPQPKAALSWLWPNGKQMVFVYYEATYRGGEITISPEHKSFKWIPLSDEELTKHFTTYHLKALQEYTANKK